jgi:hypothetical protein
MEGYMRTTTSDRTQWPCVKEVGDLRYGNEQGKCDAQVPEHAGDGLGDRVVGAVTADQHAELSEGGPGDVLTDLYGGLVECFEVVLAAQEPFSRAELVPLRGLPVSVRGWSALFSRLGMAAGSGTWLLKVAEEDTRRHHPRGRIDKDLLLALLRLTSSL